ncbi:unnamed protein product, partial [Prunus brigantina]
QEFVDAVLLELMKVLLWRIQRTNPSAKSVLCNDETRNFSRGVLFCFLFLFCYGDHED